MESFQTMRHGLSSFLLILDECQVNLNQTWLYKYRPGERSFLTKQGRAQRHQILVIDREQGQLS